MAGEDGGGLQVRGSPNQALLHRGLRQHAVGGERSPWQPVVPVAGQQDRHTGCHGELRRQAVPGGAPQEAGRPGRLHARVVPRQGLQRETSGVERAVRGPVLPRQDLSFGLGGVPLLKG